MYQLIQQQKYYSISSELKLELGVPALMKTLFTYPCWASVYNMDECGTIFDVTVYEVCATSPHKTVKLGMTVSLPIH